MSKLTIVYGKGLDAALAAHRVVNTYTWNDYDTKVYPDAPPAVLVDPFILLWLIDPSEDLVRQVKLQGYERLYILSNKLDADIIDPNTDTLMQFDGVSLFAIACLFASQMATGSIKGFNAIDVAGLKLTGGANFHEKLNRIERSIAEYLVGNHNMDAIFIGAGLSESTLKILGSYAFDSKAKSLNDLFDAMKTRGINTLGYVNQQLTEMGTGAYVSETYLGVQCETIYTQVHPRLLNFSGVAALMSTRYLTAHGVMRILKSESNEFFTPDYRIANFYYKHVVE